MCKADEIAETLPLTATLLIEEVFCDCKETLKNKRRKRKLIQFIDEIVYQSYSFSNDKTFVIYCLLRLWYEERVDNFDFRAAWKKQRSKLIQYKIWYYAIIADKQEKTIVV